MHVNLKALIERLDEGPRKALEAAAGLCLSRTHYDVEIEHYLLKLFDEPAGEFLDLLDHFEVNRARLAADLTHCIDKLRSGNARTPALSPSTARMLNVAWSVASLDYRESRIRTGHTVVAILQDEELQRQFSETSRLLAQLPVAAVKDFVAVAAGNTARGGTQEPAGRERGKSGSSQRPHLDQYTIDLTERARAGQIDPVLGRDSEIRQVVDILTRRRQNNPILVGEAGVGKTAIAEGFAARVAVGDVPESLRKVAIRTLDLALLQAGAGVKGEFESRLKGLIDEVKSSPTPIVLFIDEAHTLIGAGGQAGQNDAANLLKPALARGELRTIAATTWSEYKRYVEKDPALSRRFQMVKVEEPDELRCVSMLRGVVGALEAHHKVRVLDSALEAAVRLSHRYLPERQLPDKAVSVLDTACARLAIGRETVPGAIDDALKTLEDLAAQRRILNRESVLGADHAERLNNIDRMEQEVNEKLTALHKRWETEKELVDEIHQVRSGIESDPAKTADLKQRLLELTGRLAEVQGEQPIVRVCVDEEIVGSVISGWTGIPVGKMLNDELSAVLCLEHQLRMRVVGQDHALEAIARRVRTSRAGLDDPQKPVGVFLLVGPSGVGKTETALALADVLYGGERNLITINMSEFQEAHTVSTLKGSPPGYVGYGEGGVLTEAVRRRPYSVVLLDEVEKAHPDVLELFFQVFDKGTMEDGEGRNIDFKNTVIILTSNAGSDKLSALCSDPNAPPAPEDLVATLKPTLNRIFKPAFLGRVVIVPYYPVRDEALHQIIRLKLAKIQRRMAESHKISLGYEEDVVLELANRCTEVESGARNIDNILTNTMLPEISRRILRQAAENGKTSSIHVGLDVEGSFVYA